MKRFVLKAILFACLTVFPLAAGKLFIPLDWYAFRTTEVLEDQRDYLAERGPYYPRQHHRRTEEGDIGRRTPYAVKKEAEWFTDEFGYRNRVTDEKPEIVLVGRSEIAGLSLTQEDIFSESLQDKLHRPVYSYSPKDFDFFLREWRFQMYPPKIVVFSMVERSLADLVPLKELSRAPVRAKTSWLHYLPVKWQIALDQMKKKPLLGKFVVKSLLYERFVRPELLDPKHRMLFFPMAMQRSIFYENDASTLTRAVETFVSYRDELAKRNIRFIFLPVPNKETIYWEWTGQTHPPRTLSLLSGRLRERGVEVADLEEAFMKKREQDGRFLYQLDDTHWNPAGVRLATERLAAQIQGGPPSKLSTNDHY